MGNRLSKIYTRTGDDGTTGLGDGARVPKESLRVEAYGTRRRDQQLPSAWCWPSTLAGCGARCLTEVQHDLFDLGGELCIPGHRMITAAYVDRLERELDGFNETCRRSRNSSCPAAARPRPPATWRAPCAAAPSAAAGRWRGRGRSRPTRSNI